MRNFVDKKFSDQVSYIRLTLIGSGNKQIISVNEPIDSGHEEFIWTKTEKYVSDSWYEEIKTTVNTIGQIDFLDPSNVVSFLFATDIHLNPEAKGSHTENLGKVCSEVMRACNIPFLFPAEITVRSLLNLCLLFSNRIWKMF